MISTKLLSLSTLFLLQMTIPRQISSNSVHKHSVIWPCKQIGIIECINMSLGINGFHLCCLLGITRVCDINGSCTHCLSSLNHWHFYEISPKPGNICRTFRNGEFSYYVSALKQQKEFYIWWISLKALSYLIISHKLYLYISQGHISDGAYGESTQPPHNPLYPPSPLPTHPYLWIHLHLHNVQMSIDHCYVYALPMT